jgi:hypothetical protein
MKGRNGGKEKKKKTEGSQRNLPKKERKKNVRGEKQIRELKKLKKN